MDIHIKEGTAHIFDDDIEKALFHLSKAQSNLEVRLIYYFKWLEYKIIFMRVDKFDSI